MAGFSARTALELGLDIHEPHEVRGVHKTDFNFERNDSYNRRRRLLLCCVYNLDSWSSLVTGLPRVMPLHFPSDHLNFLVWRLVVYSGD
jgi:hypothetical protein